MNFHGLYNGNKLRSREKKELLNCNLVFPLFFFFFNKKIFKWMGWALSLRGYKGLDRRGVQGRSRYFKWVPDPKTKQIIPKSPAKTLKWHPWTHIREIQGSLKGKSGVSEKQVKRWSLPSGRAVQGRHHFTFGGHLFLVPIEFRQELDDRPVMMMSLCPPCMGGWARSQSWRKVGGPSVDHKVPPLNLKWI